MGNECFALLQEWADTLLSLQIKELKAKEFYGGVMCPACVKVHGRICDAMHPFVYLYSLTGDRKYYTAAREIYQWAKANVRRPDGTNINDPNSMWYGITAFYNIQLGELLYQLGDVIEEADYAEWLDSYQETTALIYRTFADDPKWNVNYRIATSTAMAIAWRVFGEEKYYQRAKEFARISLAHMTEDGFLYGEGHYSEQVTPRGQRHIDLGYNVEESLPNLVLYLKYIDADPEMETALVQALETHLEFMLPDGGWDNSWGSRSAKWTYWGSRTSDGCQVAYAYMADKNTKFYEAAYRNFELLKACTHDGLLTGGPHYADAGEPACVHHTFCHMKGLMPMVELELKRMPGVKLPREEADGLTSFQSADVTLAARGGFRGTFSCYDFSLRGDAAIPTGGALTLLWHDKVGMLLAATMNEYTLVEEHNMQVPAIYRDICQTPRIEVRENGETYRNTLDKIANITKGDAGGVISYRAEGVLKNAAQEGTERFGVTYTMDKGGFRIFAETKAAHARYVLPVIAKKEESLTVEGQRAVLQKENGTVTITCSKELVHDDARSARILHPCGGFETAHLYVPMKKNEVVVFTITVE